MLPSACHTPSAATVRVHAPAGSAWIRYLSQLYQKARFCPLQGPSQNAHRSGLRHLCQVLLSQLKALHVLLLGLQNNSYSISTFFGVCLVKESRHGHGQCIGNSLEPSQEFRCKVSSVQWVGYHKPQHWLTVLLLRRPECRGLGTQRRAVLVLHLAISARGRRAGLNRSFPFAQRIFSGDFSTRIDPLQADVEIFSLLVRRSGSRRF
mmetsp:Transcript_73950/g.130628  ORF Transcript_73950/g.130628 Transcript_73950/m.130628 type:complete len:207 (-) Transcript_73950:227-847(-)